jgi:23S rRNA pseudouridine1911/1915/1917 synthase
MHSALNIIHEDAEILVVNKPADLVCHPTKGDVYSSLISRVRLHLGPNTGAHLINRLDRETSGVTVVAKTDIAAADLRKIWESRAVEKQYSAIVHGHLRDDRGTIDAPLGKDVASNVVIKDCVRPDGAPAFTEFSVEKRFSRNNAHFSLLRVTLHTGRKHQIRIHLAHLGHAIVGDKLYGGDEDLYLALVEGRLTQAQRAKLILPYHALHAGEVRFDWKGEPVTFRCLPEPWFTEFVPDKPASLFA